MRARVLLEFLNGLPAEALEKEVTFFNYQTNTAYPTLSKAMIVDLSDEEYLDFVFNIEEDEL